MPDPFVPSLALLNSTIHRSDRARAPARAGSVAEVVIREIRRRPAIAESGGFHARDYARYGLRSGDRERIAPIDQFVWWKTTPVAALTDRLDRARLLM